MYDKNLLYPQRQRCARCRNYFDFNVVLGLFCSYACGGLREPSRDPADWPRQHKVGRLREGKIIPKLAFWSQGQAEQGRRECGDRTLNVYLCGYCHQWHMGHDRTGRYLDPQPGFTVAAPWANH